MAKAYASAIFDAPVAAVWARVRDFGALSTWLPGIERSGIEDGRDADSVGCVRAIHLADGGFCTERLLALDDSRATRSPMRSCSRPSRSATTSARSN